MSQFPRKKPKKVKKLKPKSLKFCNTCNGGRKKVQNKKCSSCGGTGIIK